MEENQKTREKNQQDKQKTKSNYKKSRQKGITLIALVITIVILIILATITINIAFGDNGLIQRAQTGRDLYANATASELDFLDEVTDYVDEKLEGVIEPDTPVDPIIEYTDVYVTLYEEEVLGFSNDESKIEGLTPIDGKTWDITDLTFTGEISSATSYTATTPWFEDREKVTRVVFVNEIVPKSITALFMGCTNLTEIEGIENLNTSNVSNMACMFWYCSKLTSLDVSNFDTSNVTNMFTMFGLCNSLTSLNVSDFDTSNVTNMANMFYECNNLESLDVSNFDTSNVTTMQSMFYDCNSLTSLDVSNFKTSNVTSMAFMFTGYNNAMSLEEIKGLENFDTSKVTNMMAMFQKCIQLESLDLSSFDTSNVICMAVMFSSGGDDYEMSLKEIKGLEKFNTSKVIQINSMFYNCTQLTSLDLSSFDMSSATYMPWMFYNCRSLTEIKVGPGWVISEDANTTEMFDGCGVQEDELTHVSI